MVAANYYKIKVYVDDEMSRYTTWKYVIADSVVAASDRVLGIYKNRCDRAKILEVHAYPLENGIVFDGIVPTDF